MNRQGPPWDQRNQSDDLRELLRPVERFLAQVGPAKVVVIGLIVVALIWLATGIYQVGPGERGVVLTFGQHTATTSPGLQYRIPWPVQSHNIVDIQQVRRVEIGFVTAQTGARQVVPEEALMLTGDENIVHAELFVQYVVRDPVQFLFRLRSPEEVLRSAAEVALRSEVGLHPIEFTMTEGRVAVQDGVRERLQNLMDQFESGIQIQEARLLTVDPPQEVRDAFLEVVRAFEDRERLVQEAEAYSARVVPEARGEAARMLQEADGYREQRILRSEGDADRFMRLLEEYRNYPEVTRDRMYLETMERTLNKTERIILDAQGNGISPFFPIRPLISGGTPTGTGAAGFAPTPTPTPSTGSGN